MRAIDADVLKRHIDKLPALPDGNFAGNHSALKALINMQPTIEPSANNSEIPNSSDTISRQAAIDTLHMDTSIIPYKKAREYADATILEIRNRLEKLPSAQPEIVRCKDCKYWREDHTCKEHSLVSPMLANDFCSRAERRTDE